MCHTLPGPRSVNLGHKNSINTLYVLKRVKTRQKNTNPSKDDQYSEHCSDAQAKGSYRTWRHMLFGRSLIKIWVGNSQKSEWDPVEGWELRNKKLSKHFITD